MSHDLNTQLANAAVTYRVEAQRKAAEAARIRDELEQALAAIPPAPLVKPGPNIPLAMAEAHNKQAEANRREAVSRVTSRRESAIAAAEADARDYEAKAAAADRGLLLFTIGDRTNPRATADPLFAAAANAKRVIYQGSPEANALAAESRAAYTTG